MNDFPTNVIKYVDKVADEGNTRALLSLLEDYAVSISAVLGKDTVERNRVIRGDVAIITHIKERLAELV